MSGFFYKLKDVFHHKQTRPIFKIYQPSELKMIAIRTRLVLQTRMAENIKHITANDHQFRYVGQDAKQIYDILQLIGQKVIQVQTMKILIQMMRKVQNLSPQIVKTNGDITLMRKQVLWFQCVLWFRKSRQIDNLQQLNKFCWDFFKGQDITTQLDLKCQVFQIHPVLKYLKKGEVLPLKEILFYIQPYVSCNIQQHTLDNVFSINVEEVKRKVVDDDPRNKYKYGSSIPNQGGYSHINNINNYGQHQQNQMSYQNINNPSSIIYTPYIPPIQNNNRPFSNPYESNASNIKEINNHHNNQFYPNTNSNYNNNSSISKYHIQTQQQNSKYNSSNEQTQIKNSNNHNTYNNTHNINRNTVQNNQSTQPPTLKPQPNTQKQSLYNSLMRMKSTQTKKQTQYIFEPLPTKNNTQIQTSYNQQFQSAIPFINQSNRKQLSDHAFDRQMPQLQQIQMNSIMVQQQITKKQQQRKDKELQQRQQQQRRQLQAESLRLQQLKIQQQQQNQRIQQQQNRKKQQQQRIRQQRQQQQRIRQQRQQQQRIRQQRQQQQRIRQQRQYQQNKQRQEQQRQKQYQARRIQRQTYERQSSEIQLNVFADNQRQQIDRGISGRFSSTFGMKIDFDQHQGEQFIFQSPQQVKSSILRFSTIRQDKQQEVQSELNYVQKDQCQSVSIIQQCGGKSGLNAFKLFYFKVMQSQ